MLSDPQSTSATVRGKVGWASSSRCACAAPSASAKAVGMRNGSKAWMLRPVGRISGLRIRSPPGTGAMKRPAERAHERRNFGRACRRSFAARRAWPGRRASRRSRYRRASQRPSLRRPSDVEAVGDQRAFGLQQFQPQRSASPRPGPLPPPVRAISSFKFGRGRVRPAPSRASASGCPSGPARPL